jgi:hypothetical protein
MTSVANFDRPKLIGCANGVVLSQIGGADKQNVLFGVETISSHLRVCGVRRRSSNKQQQSDRSSSSSAYLTGNAFEQSFDDGARGGRDRPEMHGTRVAGVALPIGVGHVEEASGTIPREEARDLAAVAGEARRRARRVAGRAELDAHRVDAVARHESRIHQAERTARPRHTFRRRRRAAARLERARIAAAVAPAIAAAHLPMRTAPRRQSKRRLSRTTIRSGRNTTNISMNLSYRIVVCKTMRVARQFRQTKQTLSGQQVSSEVQHS